MSEREPTLRDVLGAVNELRGEMGEVRIGLGDVRGRLDRVDGRLDGLTGEVAEQGHRLDRVDGRLDRLAGEVETLRTDLPAQVVAGGTGGVRALRLRHRSAHTAGGGKPS